MELQLNESILDRIRRIDWLSNCGNKLSIEIEQEFVQVGSWQEAILNNSDQNWQNTAIRSDNELRNYIRNNFDKNHPKWNAIVDSAQSFIDNEVLVALEKVGNQNNINKAIIDNICWDMIGVIVEYTYFQIDNEIPTFSLKHLDIYEAGNFPCGWLGSWPEGKLIIF